MAREHFIPAAFLDRFSGDEDEDGSARRRRLEVVPKGAVLQHAARAETIGYAKNLYYVDFDESPSDTDRACRCALGRVRATSPQGA